MNLEPSIYKIFFILFAALCPLVLGKQFIFFKFKHCDQRKALCEAKKLDKKEHSICQTIFLQVTLVYICTRQQILDRKFLCNKEVWSSDAIKTFLIHLVGTLYKVRAHKHESKNEYQNWDIFGFVTFSIFLHNVTLFVFSIPKSVTLCKSIKNAPGLKICPY